MKYLKLFNESQSDSIIDDVEDICVELKDIGFQTGIGIPNRFYDKQLCYLSINRKGQYFDYNEVSEVVDRLIRYLGDKFIKLRILKDEIDDSDPINVYEIEITFNL